MFNVHLTNIKHVFGKIFDEYLKRNRLKYILKMFNWCTKYVQPEFQKCELVFFKNNNKSLTKHK